jgi:hypothetical protein
VLDIQADIYNLHLLIHDYFSQHLQQHSDYSQIKQTFCDVFADIARNVNQSTNLEIFNLIEPHFKKTIVWYEDKENTDFAYILNQLAELYRSQGHYGDAEPFFLQSLDIYKR